MGPELRANWSAKSLDDVVQFLTSVDWSRGAYWDGVAGKWVTRGVRDSDGNVTGPVERLSLSGVKEYGHALIDALLDSTSPAGQRIRQAQ